MSSAERQGRACVSDLAHVEKILNNNANLQSLIDLTRGLFHVEMLSKLFSSVLEALAISYGFLNAPRGCTPGKFLMGLEVVQYVDLQPIPNVQNAVNVARHPHVSFKKWVSPVRHGRFSSLVRSLIKNMVTNFFFPVNAFCYTFNYNQAIYDYAAKTIVVTRGPLAP